MADRYQRNFVLPGYTPMGWWECDVFEVTPAGYFHEYEIKLSRADFLIDRDKSREVFPRVRGTDGTWNTERKHTLLGSGNQRGPCTFTFVIPLGLVPSTDIPDWAGVMEVQPRSIGHRIPGRLSINRIKESPRLHETPIDPKVRAHANSVCYWRMHNVLTAKAREDYCDNPAKELPEMTNFAYPGIPEPT